MPSSRIPPRSVKTSSYVAWPHSDRVHARGFPASLCNAWSAVFISSSKLQTDRLIQGCRESLARVPGPFSVSPLAIASTISNTQRSALWWRILRLVMRPRTRLSSVDKGDNASSIASMRLISSSAYLTDDHFSVGELHRGSCRGMLPLYDFLR